MYRARAALAIRANLTYHYHIAATTASLPHVVQDQIVTAALRDNQLVFDSIAIQISNADVICMKTSLHNTY